METWVRLFDRAAGYATGEEDVRETLDRVREPVDDALGGGGG